MLVHGVIDLHCHVLPGIDDGPETFEESVELARAAAAAGTRTIVATPHVSWEYRNEASEIARLVGEVNERLADAEVPVEVRAGAEIAMTVVGDLADEELSSLTLGGGGWLLIEPPFTQIVTGLDAIVADLQQRGYGVVIAHPERCPAFHVDRGMLGSMVAGGALCSITAGSLTGRFGGPPKALAQQLIEERLVHDVASDAHDAVRRSPSIAAELAQAGLGGLADWLTLAVPGAIIDGRPVPPRPAVETSLGAERRGVGGLLRRKRR